MNFTVQNNRLTMYMTTIKPGMKTRKKAAFSVYHDMPAVSFWSYHLSTCGRRAFPAHPKVFRSRIPHVSRDGIKDPVPQSFRRFIGLRCVSCNLFRTCCLLEYFSAKKECVKKFRLHVKKWWWHVTTTFKSGGDMSPPSHTKLRLWKIYPKAKSWLRPKWQCK